MWPVPEREDPVRHLRGLLRRWRAEELTLRAELGLLAQELETDMAGTTARREQVRAEIAHLAIEMLHVRLALQGAGEELAALVVPPVVAPACAG